MENQPHDFVKQLSSDDNIELYATLTDRYIIVRSFQFFIIILTIWLLFLFLAYHSSFIGNLVVDNVNLISLLLYLTTIPAAILAIKNLVHYDFLSFKINNEGVFYSLDWRRNKKYQKIDDTLFKKYFQHNLFFLKNKFFRLKFYGNHERNNLNSNWSIILGLRQPFEIGDLLNEIKNFNIVKAS